MLKNQLSSKLHNFLLIAILLLLTGPSCKKERINIIPPTYVDFTIRLTDPLFIDLNAVGNSVIVTKDYNGLGSAGYKDHGIIVYRAGQAEFYAYDRTCTWEDSLNVAVEMDLPTDLSAQCPVCGSEYILPSSGYPTKDGPAVYPLQYYKTSYDEETQTVWVYN